MKAARFDVEVTEETLAAFAALSGDYNPLHTDIDYAAGTAYRRRVLHGAFAAGLLSRMAGMHLPGEQCLLHGMRLKFVAPMIPPLTLRVDGRVERATDAAGEVSVTVTDAETGRRYVEGSYGFGYHDRQADTSAVPAEENTTPALAATDDAVLVTGASGSLGTAVCRLFGRRAVGLSRADEIDTEAGHALLLKRLGGRKIAAAVHCGWPATDNQKLIRLTNVRESLLNGFALPMSQAVALASLLTEKGVHGGTLVLIGSTAAHPGRHMWRSPLYSLSKAMVPTLAQILAMELSAHQVKCVAVAFDMLAGGMSENLSPVARQANMDRSPWGTLMDINQAAESIRWLIDHPTNFISGATLELSGGAIP